MKLTAQQLSSIETFIRQKGVGYTDVQMEVLDHLASSVEDKITENENIGFETALQQTYASFGIFGLSTITDSITEGLSRRYNKIFWKHFLSFFTKYLPFSLFAALLSYKLLGAVNTDYFLLALLLVVVTLIVGLVVFSYRYKAYSKFMVYKISMQYFWFIGSFFSFLSIAINFGNNATLYGLNLKYAGLSFVLLVFCAYTVSAINAAKAGINESRLLMQKYRLYQKLV